MKSSARVVVVGGGIVGVSVLYGLARRGCSDAMLLEQHELTSGSTWHAAGLVQKYIHERFRSELVKKSIDIYTNLQTETGQAAGWHGCGSLRIASTPERALEFRKYMDRAQALGLAASFVSAEEARAIWPLLDNIECVTAAVFNPDDGHVAPADVTMGLAAGARARGAQIHRGVKVTSISRQSAGEWRVGTPQGDVLCEHVVLATGMYARETASLLDIDLPCVPIVHQYMVSEPIAAIGQRRAAGLPELPILKGDMFNAYFREERGGLMFGPYEPGEDLELFATDGVPEGFVGALLPAKLEPVEAHIEAAVQMVPAFGEAGIRSNVRGPINLTPDGKPLIGPAPGRDRIWLAEAFTGGPTMGGGVGQVLARWILEDDPGMDMAVADPARYGEFAGKRYAAARNREAFGNTFGIFYPDHQMSTARGVKRFPVHEAYTRAGAVWASDHGWELPAWFARDGDEPRDAYSFRRANYFDAVGEECRAVREAAGLINLSHLAKFELSGPGAGAFLDHFLANRLPLADGRVRLCHHLTEQAGVAGEFTVLRLSAQRFYLAASARLHRHHRNLLEIAMPGDGSVQLEDLTYARGVLSLVGPRARDILSGLTEVDLSDAALPWMRAASGEVAFAGDVRILRTSYVGEVGWELHHPIPYQAGLYEALLEAGTPHGLRHVGGRAMESLRLDKSYRAMGRDLGTTTTLLEAGMERFVPAGKGEFQGRSAFLVQRQAGPQRRFAVLDVEPGDADATAEEGVYRGGELVGSVASGGYSHTLRRLIVHTYLPVDLAAEGTELEVSVLMERRPARVIAESPFDPGHRRLRGQA